VVQHYCNIYKQAYNRLNRNKRSLIAQWYFLALDLNDELSAYHIIILFDCSILDCFIIDIDFNFRCTTIPSRSRHVRDLVIARRGIRDTFYGYSINLAYNLIILSLKMSYFVDYYQ